MLLSNEGDGGVMHLENVQVRMCGSHMTSVRLGDRLEAGVCMPVRNSEKPYVSVWSGR